MKRGLEIGTVVLLLMGAALVSRSLIVRYAKPKADSKFYQALEGEKSTDAERLNAMMKLAAMKDPTALKVAKRWLGTSADVYKLGAVQALSFYDDKDVLADVQKAYPNLEEYMRFRTLEYFTENHASSERKNWLEDLAKSTDRSTELSARVFLLIGETDQAKVAASLHDIFIDFDGLSSFAQERVLSLINAQFGDYPAVHEWLLKLVDSNRPTYMQVIAIQKLSTVKESGLDRQLARLAHHAEPDVRAAAIAAIPHVCPRGYWNILDEAAKTEPNAIVLTRILEDLSSLKGKEAQKTFNVVKSRDGKLPKDVISKLPDIERNLASAPQTNACGK